MTTQTWHWEQRHTALQNLFDGLPQNLSAIWGFEQALALAATHTLNAPSCIDFMKFLPTRYGFTSHGEFDVSQPVVWQNQHQWTEGDKQAKLHVGLQAFCRGELVAEYELEYCQRAPRSKPQPVEESIFSQQRKVDWPNAHERYKQFLEALSWPDPIYSNDEFAQAMGFPRRILNDFFVFAALWFEGQKLLPTVHALHVMCGQPAMAVGHLDLMWDNSDQGVEGRVTDETGRPIFTHFQMHEKQGA
ncbi:MAG: hypothetical protein CMH56_03265 [Myxococcales bacterium]|nr:hypothetical protein [Myxococcales bacterium]|tara:strand:- start:1172 stop:1909 length:738 start_codon:yes stop_codon:yes gene_type:complete